MRIREGEFSGGKDMRPDFVLESVGEDAVGGRGQMTTL